MKPVTAMFAVIILILAFSAGTAMADTEKPEVQVLPVPSITLTVANGTFYNLTYAGIVLLTPSGQYGAAFDETHWTFKEQNQTSYYYQSNVQLKRGQGNGVSDSVTPVSQDDTAQSHINANVKISLNALNYSLSNLSVMNSSSAFSNYSFPNYSVMEITVSIVLQTPVKGPGALYLVQLIKSSNESQSPVKYYLGNVVHDLRDRMNGDQQGMQILPSLKSKISAFYWWNNTFKLNGKNENMSSAVALREGGIYLEFKFPFSNSLKSVYEDPFFGIPGTPLFKNPVVKKDFGLLINYLVVHAEFLGTGMLAGTGLFGLAYSVYRKKKM